MVEIIQGGKRDLSSQGGAFIITGFTQGYAFNSESVALADTNHTLGTLIRELIRAGVISGKVS